MPSFKNIGVQATPMQQAQDCQHEQQQRCNPSEADAIKERSSYISKSAKSAKTGQRDKKPEIAKNVVTPLPPFWKIR